MVKQQRCIGKEKRQAERFTAKELPCRIRWHGIITEARQKQEHARSAEEIPRCENGPR